jgi:hypothetical protein
MAEPVGVETTPVVTTPVDNTAEITTLKEQLDAAQERINKYDGERKDYSEQKNLISDLTAQVEELKSKIQDDEDEDSKHLTVTQEELRSYKAGEAERFAGYTKAQQDKITAEKKAYQDALGQESLKIKDEALFDEICKEHDALVVGGGMPESTGDPKIDAKIAWRESENSLFRKKLALGKTMQFETDPANVNKPVIPGTQVLSTATTTQTTKMPDLPDDAKEFIALMGDSQNPDKVNAALGIK